MYNTNNTSIIASEMSILHFDEYPILFVGKNKLGNWIVGSFLFEDYDNDIFKYFHLEISKHDLISFLKREIPYRTLFEKALKIYLLDKSINEAMLNCEEIQLININENWLPLVNSFCPESHERESLLKKMQTKPNKKPFILLINVNNSIQVNSSKKYLQKGNPYQDIKRYV